MKHILRFLIFAAIAQNSTPAQAPVTAELKRMLVEGSTDIYKVEEHENRVMTSEYFNDIEFDTTRKATVRISTGKLDADKASVGAAVNYNVDLQEVDGPSDGTASTPDPVQLKGSLDSRGRLTTEDSKGMSEEARILAGRALLTIGPAQAGIVVDLPDHALAVGESWKTPVRFGQPKDQAEEFLTAKLVKEEKVGSRDAWVVSTSGTIKVTSELKMKFQLEGKTVEQTMSEVEICDVAGEIWIEKCTGRTLKAQSKVKKKHTTTFAPNNAKIEGKFSTTFSSVLQSP